MSATTVNTNFEKSGFGVSITIGDYTFLCKSVTPPGFDNGDDIDITNSDTIGAMEYAPADLGSPTDFTATIMEDNSTRSTLQTLIGQAQTVVVNFKATKNRSTQHTITFANAWLRSWTPSEHAIGEAPTIELSIGIAGGSHTGSAADYHPEGTYA